MSEQFFSFQGQNYEYFDHPYNNTRINERTVEIPISLNFLNQFKDDMIEIGCVTPYYFESNHEVFDLADNHPRAKHDDAVSLDYKNKNVLSISTIEHIGRSDYGIQEKEKNSAIDLCKKIISESLNYFITWPLGYNKILDDWALNEEGSLFIARQDGNKYLWQQKKIDELTPDNKKYGTFHCANTIIIFTNLK